MPSGNIDKPGVEDNRDGTVSIRYDPREEGLHELALKYNGEHVQGKSSVISENLMNYFISSVKCRFPFQVSRRLHRIGLRNCIRSRLDPWRDW
jgi:hypothetical protein